MREAIAKRFRKVKDVENGVFVYEDLESGRFMGKRPSIFKMLWPWTKF